MKKFNLFTIAVGFCLLMIIYSSIRSCIATRNAETNVTEPVVIPFKQKVLTEEEKKEIDRNTYISDSSNFRFKFNELKKISADQYGDYEPAVRELVSYKKYFNEYKNKAACKYLVNDFKKLLQEKQIKNYPILRKLFAVSLKQKLWEHNIKVTSNGSTITFVGARYASNANKKEDINNMQSSLELLRFKRVNFKWIEHEDAYTYYDIDSPKDNEIK